MFSVSSVSKSYGKNKVLTDVSLSVSPGECIALLDSIPSRVDLPDPLIPRRAMHSPGDTDSDTSVRTLFLP